MKYNKVVALLTLYGKNLSDYAQHMGIKKQQLSNKKKIDSFRVDEFIHLADLTGTTLAFIDKNGDTVIKFDINDIKKES